MQSRKSSSDYFTEFPVEVKNVNYFNSEATKSIESVGSVGSAITTGLTVGLVVVSFPLALTLIKLFQMIDFLLFINVDLPVNTKAFLSLFDQNVLKFFPNPFEVNEAHVKCVPHRIFSQEDMSCSMLNNIGEQLLQILGLLLVKGVFSALVYFSKPSLNKKFEGGNSNMSYDLKLKKVEQMIVENKTGKALKSSLAHRLFSKVDDFMTVEFFCNFLMAI